MKILLALTVSLFFISCQQLIDAPVPDLKWDVFDAPDAKPLNASERNALEGIYSIEESNDDFGKEAALKWSYVADKNDTTYYLSFFCAEDVRYFICRGKKNKDTILLNGYWRNIENTKTGRAHFKIPTTNNVNVTQHLTIAGTYGMNNDEPEKKISFQYARPLFNKTPFQLIAHRGGGVNNDLLPASENSLEMLLLAAQLGGNGTEIDIQLTKDSVPVLYHDGSINDRLTTKTKLDGPIKDYTLAELEQGVTLKRGGKIPTLKQALETILYKTPLEFVWLDCKYKEGMAQIAALQKEFTGKAAGSGRKLEIVIGMPDEEVLNAFMQLPGYKNIPSLCELDTAKVMQSGAAIWAPTWVKGKQNEEVSAIQAKGKRAFVWTVDVPDKVKEFMYEGRFNGMTSNRLTMAAYYHYARQ